MNFLERKEKLEYLLELIDKDRCFSLQQISQKFGCSQRTVKRMISLLRDQGHNIKYSKTLKKFKLKNT